MESYYSNQELKKLKIKSLGENVRLSRLALLYGPETLSIGDHSRIDDFCILTGDVRIGRFVHIGAGSYLFGKNGIEMEDFSGLSSRCSLYTESDDYLGRSLTNPTIPEDFRRIFDKGPIKLKRHSIIGAGTIIMPRSTVGIGTAVGALSFVRGELLDWSIYDGKPLEKIGERRKEIITKKESELEEWMGNQ